jgi:hypothetical protein
MPACQKVIFVLCFGGSVVGGVTGAGTAMPLAGNKGDLPTTLRTCGLGASK